MKESRTGAHEAHVVGALAAPMSKAEFRELSRKYRDFEKLRRVSVEAHRLKALALALAALLYGYLWGNDTAWPTQEQLAARLHTTVRSIRRTMKILIKLGFFVSHRVPRPVSLGGFRLVYRPGPALEAALRACELRLPPINPYAVAFFPRLKTPPCMAGVQLVRAEPCPAALEILGVTSGACGSLSRVHAVKTSYKLLSISSSSMPSLRACAETMAGSPSTPVADANTKGDFSKGGESSGEPLTALCDARVAVELLAFRHYIAHPHAPAPKVGGESLGLVTARLAELGGDIEPAEKLRRGKLAVEAAHRSSLRRSGQAPSIGYIFGSEAYFRGHLERGLAEGGKRRGPPPNPAPQQGPQEPAGEGEATRVGDPPPPRLQGQGEAARPPLREKESDSARAPSMTPAEIEAAAADLDAELGTSTQAGAVEPRRPAVVRSKRKSSVPVVEGDSTAAGDAAAVERAAFLAGLSDEDRALVELAETKARQKRAEAYQREHVGRVEEERRRARVEAFDAA